MKVMRLRVLGVGARAKRGVRLRLRIGTVMLHDRLAQDLYADICQIPIIDPHTHINPHQPAARSLDDILGYHYYTELAHSAGMDKGPLAANTDVRERIRAIVYHMSFYDNTAQYQWFLEIARAFLDFQGQR